LLSDDGNRLLGFNGARAKPTVWGSDLVICTPAMARAAGMRLSRIGKGLTGLLIETISDGMMA
jgi:hypothetical protein